MRESPRRRRLRNDLKALQRLRAESSIFEFAATGDPPESYLIRFHGRGLTRAGKGRVEIRGVHEVRIDLGASYPRQMPEMAWQSPIFHPNISGNGVVCLGGYGTYWVPSLNLDELCEMLWDMVRYRNFDVESPYNREAANWAKVQKQYTLPIDPRPIRDKLSSAAPDRPGASPQVAVTPSAPKAAEEVEEVLFLEDGDILNAEVVEPEDEDILFIE